MIPHDQQAVDMAAMVPGHTTNHDVIVLAKHISMGRQAEFPDAAGVLGQCARRAGASWSRDAMQGTVDQATLNRLPTLNGGEFDVRRQSRRQTSTSCRKPDPDATEDHWPPRLSIAKLDIGVPGSLVGISFPATREHTMNNPAEQTAIGPMIIVARRSVRNVAPDLRSMGEADASRRRPVLCGASALDAGAEGLHRHDGEADSRWMGQLLEPKALHRRSIGQRRRERH
jgi:hypothetical protein